MVWGSNPLKPATLLHFSIAKTILRPQVRSFEVKISVHIAPYAKFLRILFDCRDSYMYSRRFSKKYGLLVRLHESDDGVDEGLIEEASTMEHGIDQILISELACCLQDLLRYHPQDESLHEVDLFRNDPST